MSELPPGWTEARFGEINSFAGRTVDPSTTPTEEFELYSVPTFPTGTPEFLVGSEIGSTKQTVEPNDVLVCKINPRINRVWQVMPRRSRRQIASSEWIVMRADGLHASYLRHYFRSPAFRELICDGVTGVGGSLTRAQPKRVAEFPVPIAPLLEQKRIADKLDVLLARVDACRECLDRVPGILKRFRQSVLAAATSGELTREWRAERGIESEWREATLGSLLTDVRYGTSKKCEYEASKTPVLRIPNVAGGTVNHEDMKYADFDEDEMAKLALTPGDLLMIRSNGSVGLVGRTALVSEREAGFLYAGYLIRLRPNAAHASPAYLSLFLASPASRARIELTARSTTGVNNINAEEIRAFPVALPALDEQYEIARRVGELFAMADRLDGRVLSAQAIVERSTPSALAKAFRGELVPQDPNDEPASALLAKLKAEQANAATEPSRRRPKTLGKRPTMSNADKDSIKAAILKLKTDRFSFDELRAQVSGDYESLKAALFDLLEEPSPVVRQVFDKKAKAMQLVRVRP